MVLSNKLSLNAKKTKYIVIRPNHVKCDLSKHDIFIKNTKLNRIGNDCEEKSVTFLGINIDENLTWKSHINKQISWPLFFNKTTKTCFTNTMS